MKMATTKIKKGDKVKLLINFGGLSAYPVDPSTAHYQPPELILALPQLGTVVRVLKASIDVELPFTHYGDKVFCTIIDGQPVPYVRNNPQHEGRERKHYKRLLRANPASESHVTLRFGLPDSTPGYAGAMGNPILIEIPC